MHVQLPPGQVKPQPPTRLKRVAFVVLIIAMIALPIVLAEVYLRGVGLGYPILFYTNASYRFSPQPNQKQVRLRNASVTIDSKGLRSLQDWASPADAKILFVGDSVTWGGTQIDDRDTFAQGVCERLELETHKKITCGNAGVNSYGTDNMAERIRYKDFSDESVLVVTLISLDVVRGLVDQPGHYIFTDAPPAPFRALYEVAAFSAFKLTEFLRPSRGSYRGGDDVRVAERSLQNLFSAIRETGRDGRKVLIVHAPAKWELGDREGELTKHVKAVLARSGYDVLDLHDAVTAARIPDFYYDDVHPDVSGHRFIADQIAARLKPDFAGDLNPPSSPR
jgi:lysophospholipase L1-like esterase